MKIVHICTSYLTVDAFLAKLVEQQKLRGHDVYVVANTEGRSKESINSGTEIVHMFFSRRPSFRDIWCLFGLFKIIYLLRPDIVSCHTPKASLLGTLAGRMCFVKTIIYNVHGFVSMDGYSLRSGLTLLFEKIPFILADVSVFVSKSLMHFSISNRLVRADQSVVVNQGSACGVSLQSNESLVGIQSLRLKRYGSSGLRLLCVGRVSNDKNIVALVRTLVSDPVVSKLMDDGLISLEIVGGIELISEDEKELRHWVSLFPDCINIHGHCKDVARFYCNADILLHPSLREGFGMVIVEAAGFGLPAIGFDIPGVKDAIENGVTGDLVEYPDLEGFLDKVITYAKCKEDRKKLGEYSKNGIARTRVLYKDTDVIEGYCRFYETYGERQ